MAEPGEEEGGKPAPAESENGGKKGVEGVEATDTAPSKTSESSVKGTASGPSLSASTEGVSSAGSTDVVGDNEGQETVADDASITKGESKPGVKEQIVNDAEEEDMEEKGHGKAADSERLSDNESYHSPAEEEYKSESDDASGLLRGRRREASDEEDEEDEEEDGVSVADEEAQQARGGTAAEANFRGEGAYESDGMQTVEKTDGDADDEGDDLLDDDSNDLDVDEGKADEEAPPHGEEQVAPPRAEVKKPAEPFVVPTAGPFYMHDDRFGGEETKRPGKGKKLWDGSADSGDRWPHDMFEKLNLANDAPPVRRGDGERRRGRGGYGRGGRGESAAYGGMRGGRGGGRGFRNGPEGGRRNFVAVQNSPGGQPQSDPALLPTPQYNLELLQEFPPPQSTAQNWGGQPAASRQATANGTSDFSNNRDQGGKGGGQSVRGNVSRGQKAVPAWADSEPGAATGWGDEVQERGAVATNRGGGGRSAADGQALGRGAGAGRGEYKPRTPPRSGPVTSGDGLSAARRRDPTGWGPAAGEQQPVEVQGAQAGYNRGGGQPTGWDNRSPAGNQERAPGASQGRSATVGTMTSPRPLEQTPSREEKRQQYQPPPESRPAARREIEVQTDLAPEVSSGSRNTATTPRGGAAKSGPPPGFAGNSGNAPYGSSGTGGGDYGAQYRAPASAGATGRSSPGLHLASEYVPNSATQQVLPYGQSAVPPVGGYSLPPYPSHLPPYAYGSSEVTWVPVLNNPQANALPPPPNVYGTNPYASPYSLGGAEASPYVYSSQAVTPPEYAPAKQGLGTNAAISRPPSASTLWRPPASAGLSTGALDSNADAYGQRQSKPRRYTEMTFQ